MADMVLRLRVDPATGRREVVVDYHSDSDALPIEHEDEHKRLAGMVVEGGLQSDRVTIAREAEAPANQAPAVGQPVPAPVKARS